MPRCSEQCSLGRFLSLSLPVVAPIIRYFQQLLEHIVSLNVASFLVLLPKVLSSSRSHRNIVEDAGMSSSCTMVRTLSPSAIREQCCAGPTSAAHGGSGHERVTPRLHRLFVWDRRGSRSSA